METKTAKVELDAISIATLEKVPSLHRHAVINMGVRLIEKTQFFKTLCGIETEQIEEVLDINLAIGAVKPKDKLDIQTKIDNRYDKPIEVEEAWEGF
jgi:hypothetical protein